LTKVCKYVKSDHRFGCHDVTYFNAAGHFSLSSNMSDTATLRVSCWIHSLYRLQSPACLS
jgi:hypothetical protein